MPNTLVNGREILDNSIPNNKMVVDPSSYATTGVYYFGGLSINADNTKFDVGPVKGMVVTPGTTPTVTPVDFAGQSGILAVLRLTYPITYVLLDANGTVIQQPTRPTATERTNRIYLGAIFTPNFTNITGLSTEPIQLQGIENRFFGLSEIFGVLNDSGNVYAPVSGLTISKTAGVLWRPGINYANDVKNPDYLAVGASSPVTFVRASQTGVLAGTFTNIDPNNYDNGGVITAVPNNKFTIQRINLTTAVTGIYYGQTVYNSMAEAEAAITTEAFNVSEDLRRVGCLRTYLIVKQNATDLLDTTHAKFITASKFGNVSSAATAVWGSISGTLANQTDLQTALNGKSNTGHTHTASEITDFNSAARAQTEAELQAGSGITITPSGSGASRVLTIASTAGSNTAASYSQTIGDGINSSYTVVHSLGTKDVIIRVRDTSTDEEVIVDTASNNLNSITVTFASVIASNTYRVTIIKV